jgi:hexosaminidase
MIAMWCNPFDPARMQKETTHLADLRQARLLAEDAEEHLDRALEAGADPLTLSSLRFGSRLLDYAAQKFQTVPELEEMWTKLGPKRPVDQLWWNNWASMVIYPDHSRLADLEDTITELRSQYRAEWTAEYLPYRLDSALGHWDMEYQFWASIQARLLDFSESSHEGEPLPKLESFVPRN